MGAWRGAVPSVRRRTHSCAGQFCSPIEVSQLRQSLVRHGGRGSHVSSPTSLPLHAACATDGRAGTVLIAVVRRWPKSIACWAQSGCCFGVQGASVSCGRGHGRAGWGAATDIAAIVIAHMLIGMIVDAASTHDCHAVVAQGAVFASGGYGPCSFLRHLYPLAALCGKNGSNSGSGSGNRMSCHVMSPRSVCACM